MIYITKQWIRRRYGCSQGFILTQWHRLLYFLGHYHKYRRINWSEVERLVFVCKGNICRSPFAELVARSQGLISISCGIDTVDGMPPNEKATEAATRKERDLGLHKTRTIESLTIKKGDLLVAMEPWQICEFRRKYGNRIECTLLGLWHSPVSPFIYDPYGSTSEYFDRCFDQIEKSVYGIKSEIHKAKSN